MSGALYRCSTYLTAYPSMSCTDGVSCVETRWLNTSWGRRRLTARSDAATHLAHLPLLLNKLLSKKHGCRRDGTLYCITYQYQLPASEVNRRRGAKLWARIARRTECIGNQPLDDYLSLVNLPLLRVVLVSTQYIRPPDEYHTTPNPPPPKKAHSAYICRGGKRLIYLYDTYSNSAEKVCPRKYMLDIMFLIRLKRPYNCCRLYEHKQVRSSNN